MRTRTINRLSDVSAADWNKLAGKQNPFVRHEFLLALENSKCVSPETGWAPQHLLVENDDHELIAAVPLYLKTHSYGEYVFDWAWAEAYERCGQPYYPKLISAVPFSPVTGPRILSQSPISNNLIKEIGNTVRTLAQDLGASSLHWLFTTAEVASTLAGNGYMQRTGFQYHWSNNDYRDFDHFLQEFSSDKRKKIRRERRLVREQDIQMRVIEGEQITAEHWDRFFGFYRSTILNHGAIAYLNQNFFNEIGDTMPENIVFVFAYQNNQCIAGALNLKGIDTLYGRYWGCNQHFDSLHFEACYYSAIEYCIQNRLKYFEAGAQGGHKLSRGFLPTPTYSVHWLQQQQLSDAVERYLQQEQNGIEYQMNELNEHAPFKRRC